MVRVLVIAAFILGGCATVEQAYVPDTLPQLIRQEPLPPWPFRTSADEITLDIKIRVGGDGSIKDVSFLTPSLNEEWNILALQTMRGWKFSPAIVNGQAIPIWIRQTIHLRFEEASYLRLAEIVCPDRRTADSVYALLDAGAPFDSLARVFSTSASRIQGGFLGDVDLRTYPLFVRRELRNVRTDHFTSPILLGRDYIIFKCLAASPHTRPVS
jgi:TonB family protein